MRKKKLLNLFAILIGVLMCFSFSKVYATDSNFAVRDITRENLRKISESNTLTVANVSKILGIYAQRSSQNGNNAYQWDPQEIFTNPEAQNSRYEEAQSLGYFPDSTGTAWKIATYPSLTASRSQSDYSDLYYCLNVDKGFGISNGYMANGAKDTYTLSYDMKSEADKSAITTNAGSNVRDNYNKILWILENSYIPGVSSNAEKTNLLRNAASKRDTTRNFAEYLSNNLIDNDSKIDLTDEEIEVVQQLAIWHFTNGYNITPSNLYKNTKKISGTGNNYDVGGYGVYFVREGEIKVWKMNALYDYLIQNASDTYENSEPTLTLSNSNAVIEQSGSNYIAGPFTLNGTDTEKISTIDATSNKSFTLLDENKQTVNNNDFTKVIGKEFYLRIGKSEITESTQITLNLKYKYNTKTLTYMTASGDVQPVVLVKKEDKEKNTNTNINIDFGHLKLIKTSEGQTTPDATEFTITGPNNYSTTIKYANFNHKSDRYHLIENLPIGTYKVTEKTNTAEITNYTLVVTGDNGASKDLTSNSTVEFYINNNYTQFLPDLALRKFITKIGNKEYEREPQIGAWTLDNGTTVTKTHQKNALKVETGDIVTYTIRIYNEGNVKGKATKVTDYLPDGLELVENNEINSKWTKGTTKNGYTAITTDYLKNTEIAAHIEGQEPSYEDLQIVCKVTAKAGETAKNLKNIAEITNATYEAGTNDIDSIPGNVHATDSYAPTNPTEGRGEQDDDDFELLVLDAKPEDPAKPDLALRKFITKIGSREYEREPQIGAWTLDNGTTATKTHPKNALNVETGDIVTYTIRIYNEGNVKGKATKVTDYLPEGLELVEDNEINSKWTKGTTKNGYTAITTDALKDIEIDAYSGRGIPKFEDLQIVCKVTANEGEISKNLKNIAEITNATYERGTSDIDSKPGNVHATDSYAPTNPTEGRGEQDDDDFELLVMGPRKPELDLALRKFITKVNDTTVNREPQVDTSTIDTTGTARYVHPKNPISVQVGDIVTYKIRVYNEGETDGYVAKITDHLPEWLDFISDDEINQKYLWSIENGNPRTISTDVGKKEDNATAEQIYSNRETKQKLKAYDGGETPDYIDVEIRCRVNENAPTSRILTNIAEISKMQDSEGTEIITDRDSKVKPSVILPSDEDLPEYTTREDNGYFPGQEDDDDFEKVIVEKFDLALRKFITKIGNTEYDREPEVDTSKLGIDGVTTATYNHDKTPLNVKKGDIITYTLRIYNEGTLSGKATEVFDYIPEGLEFVEDSSINHTYGWEVKDGKIVTSYLDDDSKEIKAVITNAEGKKVLDYQDVQVQLKVTADPKEYAGSIITNYAEIGEDSNNDIDSTPGNGHGDMNSKEDDDDFEPVKLVYFDLALRKFITKVNTIDYNNRVPEVDTSKYGTLDENGKKITSFTYNHTKDPVVVETGSNVTYTIRVYNEGSLSGYAEEITDNIPEGLEFLPEDKTNKDYKWKMLDEQGNVTEDVTKAKKITTTYLVNDILDAYKKENGTEIISYKDVKVAFKVTEPGTSDRLVINTAEISKASDEDIDSTPGNNDLNEDDIDREYLKVKYFDLALKKWVTATKVIYNGKTKTTKTGFNEDSTGIAKVDLVGKNLKKTTVKFVYKIKVINEGEVAGYATEVEDYIPNGLKFVQADNPKWKLEKNNVAVTDQLKDTLLEPGQSATIEIVLTWKNSASNMGVKTNWAEIKSDSGDDIDSVPDNYKKEEDDIDNAKVVLSIKTGNARTYIMLALISVIILGGGTFLIKKYVVK